jgi:hypothetical protein
LQVYIFEVVPVNPAPGARVEESLTLRLKYKEELKLPVANICDINGYIVQTLGQKVSVTPGSKLFHLIVLHS